MKSFLKIWIGIALLAVGFGLCILTLVFFSGAKYKESASYSLTESYDNVENIDFNIGFGEVNLVEGDSFSIDAKNYMEDGLESYVQDGTWHIKEFAKNHVSIFGISISLGNMSGFQEKYMPHITITMPKDFIADRFSLDVGAGVVDVDSIHAIEGNLAVAAGELTVNRLSITEASNYHIGAGKMVLNDVAIKDIALDCGIGDVVIEGAVYGDNDISCGVGKVDLELTGNENDYSYSIDSGVGSVVINGNRYHDINKQIDNQTGNNLRLDCGVGNITLDFN